MNCDNVREQLAFLLYGELSFAEEEAVEAHLDGCSACQASLTKARELSAMFDQVAVEPSPLFLRECRDNLTARLTLDAGPTTSSLWDRISAAFSIPDAVWRPFAAMSLVAIGFFGARWTPPVNGNGAFAGLVPTGVARVRSVEPAANGTVRIVLEEARQRTLEGPLDNVEIRQLMLDATRDPSDGLRAETVALLQTLAQATDVRDALVYTLRQDQNDGVRLAALDGLKSSIHEPDVRNALADVLASDANPAMRIRAMDLLVESLVATSDRNQTPTAAQNLVDRRMIGVLQRMMSSEQENPAMRQRCQRVLELAKASSVIY
jgi:hypothetical protein